MLAAVALVAGMIWVVGRTPGWYTAQSRFNLIFFKLARTSKTFPRDLRELGLDEADARYAGTDAYMPGSPMSDDKFRERFYARTSYWQVATFYLRHPTRVFETLLSDLRTEAPRRHLYSNFPKSYGRPPGSQTERLGTWSAWRTWLFYRWPGHMVAWYALIILAVPFLARHQKTQFRSALLWGTLAVAVIGVSEFGVASLADGGETARHLWIFHVFTDVTIFMAMVFAASQSGPDRE